MAEIKDIVVVNEEVDALNMRLDNIIKSIEASVDSLKGLNERVDDKVESILEATKTVQHNEFNQVIEYLEEAGYVTEPECRPENFMEALQIIEKFYVEEQKDREKAEHYGEERAKEVTELYEENKALKERIKELEQMYDDMVAKKSKPKTPKWVSEIGSVFKSVFKNDHQIVDENFHKAFKFGDCLIATDGYRVIRTAEPLADDIPRAENEEWAKKMNSFIFGDAMKGLEFKSYELPPLSVLKELEAKAKVNKPKGGKLIYAIRTDKGLAGFNYKYLTDGMKATHSNQIRISGVKSPATMQDGMEQMTIYLLLPVNLHNTKISEEGLYWI